MQNHLLVGLGGTGGRVIRAFRKTIFQEFGVVEPDIDGVRLQYLYIDSSNELMALDDPSWLVLGNSVQLSAASQLSIRGADLSGKLDNLTAFPGIAPWIGDKTKWRDIISATVGDVVGGQKRRLGRFLFACQATKYRERVQQLVHALETGGSTGVTFHICAGLAGGTGSGSFLDAVSIIRDLFPDTDNYRVKLYLYLPEAQPQPGWDQGNYHSNGYAALVELNAMLTGQWIPHDVTGRPHRTDGPASDKLRYAPSVFKNPVTGVFLYTDTNQNGFKIDVGSSLPRLVADFLFQRLIRGKKAGNAEYDRVENVENRTDTNELDGPNGLPIRSKRFLGFGIKRIIVPEDEIREYLAFRFAQQAATQLVYNNWRDGIGYADEPKPSEFNSWVAAKDNQARLRLSDDHFLLSRGILDADAESKIWRLLSDEWKVVSANWDEIAKQAADQQWVAALERMFIDRYERALPTSFRKQGVVAFYASKTKGAKEAAAAHRREVEQHLFSEWRAGHLGIDEMRKLLAAIVRSLDERKKGFQTLLVQQQEACDKAQASLEAVKGEWAKVGLISKAMGKSERLLKDAHLALDALYLAKTQVEACGYAQRQATETLLSLADLSAEVEKWASTLNKANQEFRDSAESRCRVGPKQGMDDTGLKQNVIRFYDPALVRKTGENLVHDVDRQRAQTLAVRTAILNAVGQTATFSLLNQRLTLGKLRQIFEHQCDESARAAHDELVTSKTQGPLFGINILDKLAERYDTTKPEFGMFVQALVKESGLHIDFDDNEMSLANRRSVPEAREPSEIFMVLMPLGNNQSQEQLEFSEALQDAFRRNSPVPIVFADSGDVRNEITLIHLANCFPLRFLAEVGAIRNRYELKLAGPEATRVQLEVHLDGNGSQHQSLYVADDNSLRKNALPDLLLALVLNVLQKSVNSSEIQLVGKDADGFELDPVPLGADFAEAFGRLDESSCDMLAKQVAAALREARTAPPAKRETQKQELVQLVNALKRDPRVVANADLVTVLQTKAKAALDQLMAP